MSPRGAGDENEPRAPGVVIPAEAVATSGRHQHRLRRAWIDGRAACGAPRRENQRRSDRLAGLEPGNTVALGDLSKLSDGARVRIEKQ